MNFPESSYVLLVVLFFEPSKCEKASPKKDKSVKNCDDFLWEFDKWSMFIFFPTGPSCHYDTCLEDRHQY